MLGPLGCAPPPTTPTPPGSTGALIITCPTTLFVGLTKACGATDSNGALVVPTWSSSAPSVASFGNIGILTGRSAGDVTVTATSSGRSGTAHVSVQAIDALQADASVTQGTFQVGTTATMTLIGYYGVASADTGLLNIVVTDQNGAVVSASAPQVVAKGGNQFVLSTTFTVPAGATQVCRAAVLKIGDTTLSATVRAELFPCVPIGS